MKEMRMLCVYAIIESDKKFQLLNYIRVVRDRREKIDPNLK